MKLRSFLFLFVSAFLALTMVNDYITYSLIKINQESEKNHAEMQKTVDIANGLLASNQYTTRFARAYVATGDQNRRNVYYNILDILDGKISTPSNYPDNYWDRVSAGLAAPPDHSIAGGKSIEDIFLSLNITNGEFNKLKEAKSKMYELSKTEIHAMDMAHDYFLKKQQKPSDKISKSELDAASALLYDKNYREEMAQVAQYLTDFKSMIEERFTKKISDLHNNYNDLTMINALLSAGLYLGIIISSLYFYLRIQKRSNETINTLKAISNGNLSARSSVSGKDELGDLATLVNWTGNNLQLKVDELQEKVSKTESLMEDLKKERDRSEKLLHNILPAAIAERLTNGEDSIAEVFPEVTVLFSDIVGFTELSEKIGPSETVNMLNILFGKLDEIAEKHGVEKIKTIGDCYMVVAGVPNRDPLHCQHIAAFAMDALSCIEAFSGESPYQVQLRMGIHTGTVAAGVVGKKRFSYDLWGDVVNVASRFETTSEPNRIHASEAVKFRLSDDFLFLDAGEVKLKGKGVMRSFYLLGRKENMPEILEFKKA